MKRFLAILRYLFISPEFLTCLIGYISFVSLTSRYFWLSQRIGGQAELLKYLCFVPAGLLIYDSTVVKGILMPEADKLHSFQKWELYGDIKLGCIIGLFYAVLFSIIGIISFLFDWKTPIAYQSALLVTSFVGAMTVTTSLYFTQIKIEELFRQHS